MAQNKEKWWDAEKTVMYFPFHIRLMCVYRHWNAHFPLLYTDGFKYFTSYSKCEGCFALKISLSSRVRMCRYFAYNEP